MIVGLIQCSKTKKHGTMMAASMYYASYIWRTNFQILKARCDVVFILSDKYGLITPDEIISSYEASPYDLTPEEVDLLMLLVLDGLPSDTEELLVTMMPKVLRTRLLQLLPSSIIFNALFEGVPLFKMHKRLSDLKKQYL